MNFIFFCFSSNFSSSSSFGNKKTFEINFIHSLLFLLHHRIFFSTKNTYIFIFVIRWQWMESENFFFYFLSISFFQINIFFVPSLIFFFSIWNSKKKYFMLSVLSVLLFSSFFSSFFLLSLCFNIYLLI